MIDRDPPDDVFAFVESSPPVATFGLHMWVMRNPDRCVVRTFCQMIDTLVGRSSPSVVRKPVEWADIDSLVEGVGVDLAIELEHHGISVWSAD